MKGKEEPHTPDVSQHCIGGFCPLGTLCVLVHFIFSFLVLDVMQPNEFMHFAVYAVF